MHTITCTGTYSQISPALNRADSSSLQNLLSAPKPGFYYSPTWRSGLWNGRIQFYSPVTQKFPTGLLHLVEGYLEEAKIPYRVSGLPGPILDFTPSLRDITLRPYQTEAIDVSLSSGRGVLHLATNAGKTEVAAGVIQGINLPTLFLLHRKELLWQTVERLSSRLGIEVGSIGLGVWDPKQVTVGMVQSLQFPITGKQRDKESKEDYIRRARCNKSKRDELQTFLNTIWLLIVDECHHASSDSWFSLAMRCPAPYRFFLSGTPFDKDESRNMRVIACSGPVIARVSNADLIDQGHSALPLIRVIDIHGIEPRKREWSETQQECIINNEYRNRIIASIASDKSTGSVLILIKLIKHGRILMQTLRDTGLSEDRYAFIHGSSQNDVRKETLGQFKDGRIKVLIATTILREGVDVPAIKTLVLADAGRTIGVLQQIGRALRKKKDDNTVVIYDFADYTDPFLLQHSIDRLSYHNNEGFVVQAQDGYSPTETTTNKDTGCH